MVGWRARCAIAGNSADLQRYECCLAAVMTSEARDAAATLCPTCHVRTLPDPMVYSVVACYTCGSCGAEWSARLRNGRPDVRLYPPSAIARSESVVTPLSEWPRPRQEPDRRSYESMSPPTQVHGRMR
jgi:hypothetical protein